MKKEIKTEILSPAGSIEGLYAGINAGADAVYVGGNLFGARAYAKNPDEESLLNAIDYVHLNNKKIYMTVNTLLKNKEIEETLYNYLLPFYKNGLDAVIVQDLGVFKFIKDVFPDMDIHASTQMAITGVDGARLLKEMGATRIVTARELSLEEISEINRNVDIEIESFIHGAMCYSYSGQCLFSSILGGRSGNRGRCAGPCRQPYSVIDNGKILNNDNNQFVLSLKDMNTLEILPEILNAGVYSLKIEGRMKSSEYAALIVSIYRKYIDIYNNLDENNKYKFKISPKDLERLSGIYSRCGWRTGYYKEHNSKSMVSLSKPSYSTTNEIVVQEIQEKYIKHNKKYNVNAVITLEKGKQSKLQLTDGNITTTTFGTIVLEALNRPLDRENIYTQINKTGQTEFNLNNIDILMEDKIFMPLKEINQLRRTAIEEFKNKLLFNYKRAPKPVKISSEVLSYQEKKSEPSNPKLFVLVESNDQLIQTLKYKEINDIYLSTDGFGINEILNAIKIIHSQNKNSYIAMPYIFRYHGKNYFESLFKNSEIDLVSGYLVRNIDEISYLKKKNIFNFRTDYLVYGFNNYAINVLETLGAESITKPLELNYKELLNSNNELGELIVYGNIPLMISANCLTKTLKKCEKKSNTLFLKDRLNANFTVKNICNFCYNVVYNSLPLSLLGVSNKVNNLNMKTLRIGFSTENSQQADYVLKSFIDTFYYNSPSEEIKSYTRGHFNRGVE